MKPVKKEEMVRQGCLYARTAQEAFEQYHSAVLETGDKEAMLAFLHRVLEWNGGELYADFYYPALTQAQKASFLEGLDEEQKKVLEEFETEPEGIYYPVEERHLDFLFDITASEWLFSSFYGGKKKILIWGNYGLSFPVFCEEDETLRAYLELAEEYGLEWH